MNNIEVLLIGIFVYSLMEVFLLLLILKALTKKEVKEERRLPVELVKEVQTEKKESALELLKRQNDELLNKLREQEENKKVISEVPIVIKEEPIKKPEKVKPEEVNNLTICSNCQRPIGGAGLIAKGIIYCTTCYKKRGK